jgi:hypothetical protein
MVTLTATGDAQTTVVRDGAKLLVDGAVIGGALRADAVDDPSRRGDRSGSQSLAAGAGLSASGNFVDPTTGKMSPFSVDVKSTGGRTVEIKAQMGNPEAAWVATLPSEFVDAGVGVRGAEGFRRAGEPHLYDKVEEVGFGGAHRFKVSRGEGCGPLRMALYRVGEAWEVGFGVSEGKLSIVVDTDSAEITRGIDKLNDESSTAIQQRKFGTAIAKLNELSGFYPAGSKDAQDVEDKLKKYEGEGKARLETLDRRVDGAVKFRDAADLRGADKDAKQLADEYAGHPVGGDAAKTAAKCDEALKAIDLVIAERMAKPLERKADDFAAHKVDGKPMTGLAAAIYDEIVKRFPETEAAKRAGEKRAGLPKDEKK